MCILCLHIVQCMCALCECVCESVHVYVYMSVLMARYSKSSTPTLLLHMADSLSARTHAFGSDTNSAIAK